MNSGYLLNEQLQGGSLYQHGGWQNQLGSQNVDSPRFE
jgi:hypothetical protein